VVVKAYCCCNSISGLETGALVGVVINGEGGDRASQFCVSVVIVGDS